MQKLGFKKPKDDDYFFRNEKNGFISVSKTPGEKFYIGFWNKKLFGKKYSYQRKDFLGDLQKLADNNYKSSKDSKKLWQELKNW